MADSSVGLSAHCEDPLSRNRLVLRSAGALVAVSALGSAAHAEEERGFTIDRFFTASDGAGLLGVEGAEIEAPGAWDLHLAINAARNPLIAHAEEDQPSEALVRDRLIGDLGIAYTFNRALSLAVGMQVVLSSERSTMVSGEEVGGLSGGLGDIRIAPKLQVLHQHAHGIDLAIIPTFTVPSAQADDYRGDDGMTFAPSIALARRQGAVRVGAELGYIARKNLEVGELRIEDEVFGRAGLAVRDGAVELGAVLSLATSASNPFKHSEETYLEALVGPDFTLGGGVAAFACAGFGLEQAVGAPDWRLVAGVRFTTAKHEAHAAHAAAEARHAPKPHNPPDPHNAH